MLREHRASNGSWVGAVEVGRSSTYEQLDDRVTRLANALAADGVGPGERVVWLGQNSACILELLLASARLGAIFCPINWRQSSGELAFVLDDLDPAYAFWQERDVGDAVKEARRNTAGRATWVQQDATDGSGYDELIQAASSVADDRLVDPNASVLAIYTAAFGGRPNAALLSHTSLLAQSALLAKAMGIDRDYVAIHCAPLFHMGAYMWLLPTFLFGGTNVFVAKSDPFEVAEMIQRERVTGGFLLPQTIEQIVAVNEDGRFDLKSFRASAGGSPEWRAMTSTDESPFGRHYGGYGQTEVAALATYKAFGPSAQGTHGVTSPFARVRITDSEDRDVPAGESGEIVVRGPIVGNGYWNRPELNAERRRGGWWHTTDLGRREPDGSLTFIGTISRMLKSAGENIYPAEVEACLESHPAVGEAAIIGVPDERWVQRVKAVVVLSGSGTATEDELIDHCRERIASYKKPSSVDFVDELPHVGGAKDYDALDARFGGGNYPGGQTRMV